MAALKLGRDEHMRRVLVAPGLRILAEVRE